APGVSQELRIAGFVVGGAGVLGIAAGAYLGVHALSLKSASNADGHCDARDTCDKTGLALRGDALSSATASTVSIVLGGLATGGGIALLVASRAPSAPAAPAPSVAVGPGGAALSLRW